MFRVVKEWEAARQRAQPTIDNMSSMLCDLSCCSDDPHVCPGVGAEACLMERLTVGVRVLDKTASSPLVSVLMVVRNEQKSVMNAIVSVLSQSHSQLELLVLDGESSDDTPYIVRRVAESDPRVKLLRNPHRIIPAGLNVGLAAATGSFIARLDGHSNWNTTYLADALRNLHERPDAAGVGGTRYGVASSVTGRAIALALSSRLGVGNSIYHYGKEPQDTDHATSGVYRADLARSISGWDERLLVNEDVDFDYRLRQAGFALLYDPKMRTAWSVRESLTDFFRQYRRYGRGKAAMVRKNGARAMRARHVGAPALVLALAVSSLAAVSGRRTAAAFTPAAYLSTIIVGAWRLSRTETDRVVLMRPLVLAFTAMHLGWGIGFLEGLLLGSAPAAATAKEPGWPTCSRVSATSSTVSDRGRRSPRRRS
ncbi:MAG: glycosyltransferase [Pseudonocardia sp.]